MWRMSGKTPASVLLVALALPGLAWSLAACGPAPDSAEQAAASAASAAPAEPIPAAPGTREGIQEGTQREGAQQAQAASGAGSEGGEVAASPVQLPPPTQAPAAQAQRVEGNLTCSGPLAHQLVSGRVTVPTGAHCQLFESELSGSVALERGSALTLVHTQVGGHVEGKEVYEVSLDGGRVKGNIILSDGETVTLDGTEVGGDVRITGEKGAVRLHRLKVAGRLTCRDNALGVAGEDNTVTGTAEGQCAGLSF